MKENKENLKPVAGLKPFKHFCMSIGELPASYLETMTYYEMLVWFTKYLGDTVIPTINNNAECIDELQDKYIEFTDDITTQQDNFEEAITTQQETFETNITNQQDNYETYITGLFNELHDYVQNYFDNLDVQEEINNKLDDMVEQGTLQEIVADYLNSKALFGFDNVSSMKSSTNLIDGSYARTLGFYSLNDGGGAVYKIRTKLLDETPDEIFNIAIGDDLVADIVFLYELNVKQVGCKCDGVTDDTTKMNAIFTKIKDLACPVKIIIPDLCYIDGQLVLAGTSETYLSSITLSGIGGASSYSSSLTLKGGFKFKAVYENYHYYDSLLLQYINGIKIENLIFTTDEEVINGEIPLNANYGINLREVIGPHIINCNITKFLVGIMMHPQTGVGIIEKNNIALCNIGVRTGGAGDTSFINNHINTCGWDIYDLSGDIKEKFRTLYSAGNTFGMGIYVGGSGNMSVTGGKIEWCNIGIWHDYANGMIYDNIVFDRCTLCGIAITGHYKPYTSGIITNNIFYGCGGITPTVTYQETHIGNNITGCSIGVSATNNIMVSNNKIIGDNGSLIGAFKTSDNYYGPKSAAIIFYLVNNSSIINNIINTDSQYSCNILDAPVEFTNNVMNKPIYYAHNRSLTYEQNGNFKKYICYNPTTITFGNFNVGDVIYSPTNPMQGYIVSSAGTKTTLNVTVDVVTEGNRYYPGDNTVLKVVNNVSNINLGVGNIVSIAGVTGNKTITGVIEHENKLYLKLNSACDVAVTNAAMTNVSPSFTSFDLLA